MENPIFISYFTGDDYYDKCADILKNDLYKMGIPFNIEKVQDRGTYWKNTLYKPSFILENIKKYKRDLIWIDVDTKISIYHEKFKKWEKDILMCSHTGNLDGIKASPLGFKYNERSLDFLKYWENDCKTMIEKNDIDLDHDILKYETLCNFINRISIEIASGEGFKASDFTDGRIIKNGISRTTGKGHEMKKVINKNEDRKNRFDVLEIKDFIL